MNASQGCERWAEATMAAALLAIAPFETGGIVVHAHSGPVRTRWLNLLSKLAVGAPWIRVPLGIGDDRLLGGLDLATTLNSGSPVSESGLLAAAHGGFVVLPMAERIEAGICARIAAVMDAGAIEIQRDGLRRSDAARFGVVALDEREDGEAQVADVLSDRIALHIDLDAIGIRDAAGPGYTAEVVSAARARAAGVSLGDAVPAAMVEAAAALGIGSLRAPLLALAVARASAALANRASVGESDVAIAARLVLGPRARIAPGAAPEDEATHAQDVTDESDAPSDQAAAPEQSSQDEGHEDIDVRPEHGENTQDPADEQAAGDTEWVELVLEAAQARLPADVFADAKAFGESTRAPGAEGHVGALRSRGRRGRPAGVRRGKPGPDARLHVIETLRAAAPWQRLRRQASGRDGLCIRSEDFRIQRFKQRRECATIFCVDASGSSALHRLAEVKGAVELLLAECYIRRDQVALVAFRGRSADVLLEPTRSLTRAKRSLAGLPGGGPTPLAAGIDAAFDLAVSIERRGATPILVVLTDGQGNIARDGTADRRAASSDASAAAARVRASGVTAMVVDTSPRPRPAASELAHAMGARYLPLPRADSAQLSQAVAQVIA